MYGSFETLIVNKILKITSGELILNFPPDMKTLIRSTSRNK